MVVAFLLFLVAPAAHAERVPTFNGEFGAGTLGHVPTAMAVDRITGDILVADPQNGRIAVFDSAGNLLTSFGGGPDANPYGIAVNQSDGSVYVTDSASDEIFRYTTDRADPPTYTLDYGYASPPKGTGPGQIGSFASSLEVEAASGDLLVADAGNDLISRFGPGGAFLNAFNGSSAPSGAFTHLLDVSIAPGGDIYVVADGVANGTGEMSGSRVERFSAAGAFKEELQAAETSAARSTAVSPVNGQIVVGVGGGYQEDLGVAYQTHVLIFEGASLVQNVAIRDGEAPGPAPADVTFPAGGTPGFYVLTAAVWFETVGSGAILDYRDFFVPEVTVDSATKITGTAAKLTGTVDSGGESGAGYQFEYRLDGVKAWTALATEPADANPGPQPVDANLSGLLPVSGYEFRLAAQHGPLKGTTPVGRFTTAATPPSTITGEAIEITESSAVLNGTGNPEGTTASAFFEYGVTAEYGSRLPAEDVQIGSERSPVPVQRRLTGLSAGTTYHYRIVTHNAIGTERGADKSFTTLSAGFSLTRSYEQVTPVEKRGLLLDPSEGSDVSADGNSISYLVRGVAEDGSSATILGRAQSRRTPEGWDYQAIDPSLGVRVTPAFQNTFAISADFSHALVVSNQALAPGALTGQEDANLYVVDLESGRATLVTSVKGKLASFVSAGAQRLFVAGSPDFSWVIFSSGLPLVEGAPGRQLYKWEAGGGISLESELPGGALPSSSINGLGGSREVQLASANGADVYYSFGAEGAFLRSGDSVKPISVSEIEGEPRSNQSATIAGVGNDGRYAYLLSPARLTDSAPVPASAGETFLYRFDAETERLTFISPATEVTNIAGDGQTVYFNRPSGVAVWRGGKLAEVPGVGALGMSRISPDGRYLAFATGPGWLYEPGDVYLYDANRETTACASCVEGVATGQAGFPESEIYIGNRQQQAVDDRGEVFFFTTAALVPRDTNDDYDVYVYAQGQQALISPGTGPFDAILLDISPDGSNVFFTTAQGISSRDVDRQLDIYDARVGAGLPISEAAVPFCEGEGCQGSTSVTAPLPALGSEAAHSVLGRARRIKRCDGAERKGKKRSKPVCRKHKKKKAKHRKKPGAHGRSSTNGNRMGGNR